MWNVETWFVTAVELDDALCYVVHSVDQLLKYITDVILLM